MKILPLRDCIFVLPDEVIEKTSGGIILSDFTKKRPTSGTILAVGEEVNRLSCKHCGAVFETDELKVGDKVWYGEWAGEPNKKTIKIDGENKEIFLMTRGDIQAKLSVNS